MIIRSENFQVLRGFPMFGLLIAFTIVCYGRLTLYFNTPYLDECDYLFVGRVLLSGIEWQTQTYIFSSNLPLYAFGLADTFGGYLAGRMLSAVLGVIMLVFYYHAIKTLLRDGLVAGFSTLFLGTHASHIFVSKFATYDILCLSFFMPALWALAHAIQGRERQNILWGILAAILYSMAVLSKYIAIAYLPLLALALFILYRKIGIAFIGVVALIIGGYIFYYKGELLLLYQNQILGDHQPNSSYLQIFEQIGIYLGVLIIFALAGVRAAKKQQSWWLIGFFFVFALPLLVYHIRGRDITSLFKHVIFSILFLAPLAGIFLSELLRAGRENRWVRLFVGSVCVGLSVLYLYQLRMMEQAYPATANIVRFVEQHITPRTTIMSEDSYLFRYHFFPRLPLAQLHEMSWYDNDNNQSYTHQDVVDGIWDGKFDFVYVNELNIPFELREKLIQSVLPNKYELVFEEPFLTSQVMSRHNQGFQRLYKLRITK